MPTKPQTPTVAASTHPSTDSESSPPGTERPRRSWTAPRTAPSPMLASPTPTSGVRARDEQDEEDRGLQNQERGPHLLHMPLVQRLQRDAEVRRDFIHAAHGQLRKVFFGLPDGHVRPQTTRVDLPLVSNRCEDVSILVEIPEVGRQDTHDCEQLGCVRTVRHVGPERPTHDARIAAEPLPPKPVADQRDGCSTLPRFVWPERPAYGCPHRVGVEEVRRDPRALRQLRLAVAHDGEHVEVPGDGPLEDLVHLRP